MKNQSQSQSSLNFTTAAKKASKPSRISYQSESHRQQPNSTISQTNFDTKHKSIQSKAIQSITRKTKRQESDPTTQLSISNMTKGFASVGQVAKTGKQTMNKTPTARNSISLFSGSVSKPTSSGLQQQQQQTNLVRKINLQPYMRTVGVEFTTQQAQTSRQKDDRRIISSMQSKRQGLPSQEQLQKTFASASSPSVKTLRPQSRLAELISGNKRPQRSAEKLSMSQFESVEEDIMAEKCMIVQNSPLKGASKLDEQRKVMTRGSFQISAKKSSMVMYTPTRKLAGESQLMFRGLQDAQRKYSMQKISKSVVNLNKFLNTDTDFNHRSRFRFLSREYDNKNMDQEEPQITPYAETVKITEPTFAHTTQFEDNSPQLNKTTSLPTIFKDLTGGSAIDQQVAALDPQTQLSSLSNNLQHNRKAKRSFLGEFLTKSGVVLDSQQNQLANDSSLKTQLQVVTSRSYIPVKQDTRRDMTLVKTLVQNVAPRRRSVGPPVLKEPVAQLTAAAKVQNFNKVKSKSELNRKHQPKPSKQQQQQKLPDQSSPTGQDDFFLQIIKSQSALPREEGNPIEQHKYRTKHSMKMILKKSQQKLAEMLDSRKFQTPNNQTQSLIHHSGEATGVNESSLRHFADVDEHKSNNTQLQQQLITHKNVSVNMIAGPESIETKSSGTKTTQTVPQLTSLASKTLKKASNLGQLNSQGKIAAQKQVMSGGQQQRRNETLVKSVTSETANIGPTSKQNIKGPNRVKTAKGAAPLARKNQQQMTGKSTPKQTGNKLNITTHAQSVSDFQRQKNIADKDSKNSCFQEQKQATAEGKDNQQCLQTSLSQAKSNYSVATSSAKVNSLQTSHSKRSNLTNASRFETGCPIGVSSKKHSNQQQAQTGFSQSEMLARLAATRAVRAKDFHQYTQQNLMPATSLKQLAQTRSRIGQLEPPPFQSLVTPSGQCPQLQPFNTDVQISHRQPQQRAAALSAVQQHSSLTQVAPHSAKNIPALFHSSRQLTASLKQTKPQLDGSQKRTGGVGNYMFQKTPSKANNQQQYKKSEVSSNYYASSSSNPSNRKPQTNVSRVGKAGPSSAISAQKQNLSIRTDQMAPMNNQIAQSIKSISQISVPYQSLGQKPPIQSTKPMQQKPGSISLLGTQKIQAMLHSSILSEDADAPSPDRKSRSKQLPLEPIRTSQISASATGSGSPLPSRPLPLVEDDQTPIFSQLGDAVPAPNSTIGELEVADDLKTGEIGAIVEEEVKYDQNVSKKLHAHSNLLNAMNYHRRSNQSFVTKNKGATSSDDKIIPQVIYPSDLLLTNKESERTEDKPAPPDENSYQNPTVTESDCEENIGNLDERESVKEEDIELEDGEQRYETEGEDDSHQTTLNDRIMALPIGSPLTPNNNEINTFDLPAEQQFPVNGGIEDQEIVNDADTMAEMELRDSEAEISANQNHNRSIAKYNQQSRAQQMQTIMARSQVSLPRREPSELISQQVRSYQKPLYNNRRPFDTREAVPSIDMVTVEHRRSSLELSNSVNGEPQAPNVHSIDGMEIYRPTTRQCRITTRKRFPYRIASIDNDDGRSSQGSSSEIGSEARQRLTLRQVLNLDFQKRQSVHFDRDKVIKLEAIRQRAAAKSRREISDSQCRREQSEFVIMEHPNIISSATFKNLAQEEQNVMSTSLASFLKTKAKKAYQFGEGLVASITNTTRQLPEGSDGDSKLPILLSFDDDGLDNSGVNLDHPRRTRPPAISMRFKDKVSLKDYYEQGPVTPKHDSDNSLLQIDVIDTQVMNIEADFEQLDIGEEPIYERNAIKSTAMNIFKDKMAFLSARPGLATFQSEVGINERRYSRAKSFAPSMERSASQPKLSAEIESPKSIEADPYEQILNEANAPTELAQEYQEQSDSKSPQQARDSISDGPLGRYSNTIDFSSTLQPYIPNSSRQTERLTFGMASDIEEDSMSKLAPQRSGVVEPHSRVFSNQRSMPNNTPQTSPVAQSDSSLDLDLAVQAEEGQGIPAKTRATRRKSNHSAYVQKPSIFGSAIESLFGKNSIFSALDDPREEHAISNSDPDAESLQALQLQNQQTDSPLSRSHDRRKSSGDSLVGEISTYKKFMTRKDLLGPKLEESDLQYRPYTLVLDLDETLVHFEHRRMVYKVRPLCMRFLTDMAKLYEIVIFTAAHQTYANFILDKLDKDNTLIRHRLYRQHTTQTKGAFIKDLSRLGRPLERTLIIDNLKENFQRQRENGIECGTWKGSVHDRQLNTFSVFLTKMATDAPQDIRPHIAQFKKRFNPNNFE